MNRNWTRRTFLAGAAAAAGAAGSIGVRGIANAQSAPPDVANLPLDDFDPFAPPDRYMARRAYFYHGPTTARIFSRLWTEYDTTKNPKYGEWALIYLLPWWRSEANRAERLKITKLADRASAKYLSEQSDAPGGRVWRAVMESCKVATIGLLDSAHMLPEILRLLEDAEANDRPYYRGIVNMARTKIYYKAPAFPASLGDMNRAQAMLDAAQPEWAHKLGVWWNMAAEMAHINGDTETAKTLSTGIDTRVRPPDVLLAYSLDTAVFDAYEFLKALKSGSYSRYLFDPFFMVTKPGLPKTWTPS